MKKLQSVGIELTRAPSGDGWFARVAFSTLEHALPTRMEGHVGNHYAIADLSTAVDQVLEAATAMGISFLPAPYIYLPELDEDIGAGAGEDLRALINAESRRIGWAN